ncbi:MAG: sensor of ECF-type sigma factor [Flavobacterium sp. BFFFF1]|uniref:sensor of ECF-type sigma factor n=1 Tax=Flavobacterium sp. BFFFF1 TaxID=2015557 RepID=UPI000BCCF72E|nr:sensor of ECF-type sigma factor [Flavobacterium sp. BFFFF1]OYU81180.1 MAG: sensor of ECF-type sigma factor [Flavobacterium sp. BFFFF1]
MKATKIITLFLCLICTTAFAQGAKDKIKTLKVAFITKELALTTAEAEKFWPVFNTYEDKQFEIRFRKMRDIKKRMEKPGIDKLSDKEATLLLTQLEEAEQELSDNRKKLIVALKSVISPVKILKLKKAEDDFKSKLLKQYRENGDKE